MAMNRGAMTWKSALAGLLLTAAVTAGSWTSAAGPSSSTLLARLAQRAAFAQFVEDFWPQARRAGIRRAVYARAMRGMTPDPSVLGHLRHQPEFSTPIWTYIEKRVSDKRIRLGREKARRHARLLGAIARRYGVNPRIVLAIWGMETNFGGYTGKMSVIRSLATLAYRGRKRKYGRSQLIAALKILQHGDVTVAGMKGSWAGAMGQTQFIPTTYAAYAVDFNGDGRRDIWSTTDDALASTANYLARRGWKAGKPWGWEVVLPRGFDYRLSGFGRGHSVRWWMARGVRPVLAKRFFALDAPAWVILPAGSRGPAFLVTGNFRAILAYNNSIAYALAVGHLADRIGGGGPFKGAWPVRDQMLSRAERIELQKRLARQGFYRGAFRGHIGPRTRKAVRRFQHTAGLPADGYVSRAILNHLRQRR